MLEPNAQRKCDNAITRPPDSAIQLSIAISLKRIADAMTTDNEYGEHGSQAIYGAISRGLRSNG